LDDQDFERLIREGNEISDAVLAVVRENLALRAAARRLVAAAKAWTRANQELASPDVRQRAVDDLADAIDAFDPMLSETTPAATGDYEYGIVYRPSPDEPHRTGMTEAEAEEWIASMPVEGVLDVFGIIRRLRSPWENVHARGVKQPDSPIVILDDTTSRPIEG
jgi:hypothetical protein